MVPLRDHRAGHGTLGSKTPIKTMTWDGQSDSRVILASWDAKFWDVPRFAWFWQTYHLHKCQLHSRQLWSQKRICNCGPTSVQLNLCRSDLQIFVEENRNFRTLIRTYQDPHLSSYCCLLFCERPSWCLRSANRCDSTSGW